MVKKSQKGFSIVEGLLLLIILGIVGGAGYYVYSSQKDTNKLLDNSSKIDSSASKSTPVIKINTGTGWTTYTSEQYDYSFEFPNDWLVSGFRSLPNKQGSEMFKPKDFNGYEDDFFINANEEHLNSFKILIQVISFNPDRRPSIYSDKLLPKMTNGLLVSRDDDKCLMAEVVSTDGKYKGTLLSNGELLTATGGYCQNSKDFTDLTFEQQLSSEEFKTFLDIVSSIEY